MKSSMQIFQGVLEKLLSYQNLRVGKYIKKIKILISAQRRVQRRGIRGIHY